MNQLRLSKNSWSLISTGLTLVGMTAISFTAMALLIDSGIDIGISLPFRMPQVFAITTGVLGLIMFWIAYIAVAVGQREEDASRIIEWMESVHESLINVRYPLSDKTLYPVGESLASLFFRNRGWVLLVRTPGILIRGEVERRRFIEVSSDFISNDWDVSFAQSSLREKLEENIDSFSKIDYFPDKAQGKALMWGVKSTSVDMAVGLWVTLPRSSQSGIESSSLLKGAIEPVLALVVKQLSVLLNEVIDRKNNSKGEMFGLLVKGLVHELSGELQATYNKLAFAQVTLANDRRLSSEHERNFAIASSSLVRSHQLIELMRDIPYLQEDAITISSAEMVEFKKLLSDIVKEMRTAYPEVMFSTKGASDLVAVSAGTNIKSVLRNTIRNAASFTPEGGMVKVVCSRKGDLLTIVVLDDGPGVPDRDAESVFDPTKGSKIRPDGTKGMGVGMSVSRMIAKSYGGDIKCIPNSKAKGGCFEITLPIVAGAEK